jgi:hypothetical protein
MVKNLEHFKNLVRQDYAHLRHFFENAKNRKELEIYNDLYKSVSQKWLRTFELLSETLSFYDNMRGNDFIDEVDETLEGIFNKSMKQMYRL